MRKKGVGPVKTQSRRAKTRQDAPQTGGQFPEWPVPRGGPGQFLAVDLKPSNVLFPASGAVVLADFGISNALQTVGVAPASRVLGPDNYMSPEQMDPQAVLTPQTDVWSFGCTLLHMLEGAPPWGGRSPAEIRTALHVQRAAPNVPQALPAWLRGLLLRSLAHEPAQRPTPQHIVEDLSDESAHATLHGAQKQAPEAGSTCIPSQPSSPWTPPCWSFRGAQAAASEASRQSLVRVPRASPHHLGRRPVGALEELRLQLQKPWGSSSPPYVPSSPPYVPVPPSDG